MPITVGMIDGQQRISIWPWWQSIFCAINYPGSWLDGTLTTCFFMYIKEKIGDYKICVNQGFPWSGDAAGILVSPVPERSERRLHSAVRNTLIRLSNVYMSLRQVNE